MLEYGHKLNDTQYYKMILYYLQQNMKHKSNKCLKKWEPSSFSELEIR